MRVTGATHHGHGERRVQRLAPRPHRRESGPAPRLVGQHRVAGRGAGRETRRCSWQYSLGIGAELLEDGLGEPEPGRIAGVRAVVGAGVAWLRPSSTSAAARSPDQVGDPRWSSTTLTVSRSRSRRAIVLTKLPPWRRRPRPYAHVGRVREQLADGELAGQFRPAVCRCRAGGVVDLIGPLRVAGEDVVGRNMD